MTPSQVLAYVENGKEYVSGYWFVDNLVQAYAQSDQDYSDLEEPMRPGESNSGGGHARGGEKAEAQTRALVRSRPIAQPARLSQEACRGHAQPPVRLIEPEAVSAPQVAAVPAS